jgi:hypothetical protein
LSDHDVRPTADVSRREPQDPVSGVDQKVLPAIVVHHSLPMIAAVVLKYKPRRWIVEISSANEPRSAIAKIRLHLWLG